MIITRTPYRISFFGGGTDYRPWFEEKGGLVIASSMNNYCYISVRRLPPFFEHKTRAVYSVIEDVKSNNDIKHPAIRNCLKYLKIEEGLEIHHDGDLPARTGIGSSSSFTVGFLLALHGLNYKLQTKKELADEAIKVEQEVIGEDVGIQDQIMASFGGLQVIEIHKGDSYNVSPLILSPDYLRELEDHVLLVYTGVSRFASKHARAQIKNIENGKSNSSLDEIFSISQEARNIFLKNSDIKKIGKLMDKSWQLKRNLSKDISSNHIDEIYAIAKKNGAYGGKISGAGGGGFMMFIAPPKKHIVIKKALSKLKVWVPFQVDFNGAQIIMHDDTQKHRAARAATK